MNQEQNSETQPNKTKITEGDTLPLSPLPPAVEDAIEATLPTTPRQTETSQPDLEVTLPHLTTSQAATDPAKEFSSAETIRTQAVNPISAAEVPQDASSFEPVPLREDSSAEPDLLTETGAPGSPDEPTNPDTPPTTPPKGRSRTGLWFLFGLLVITLFAGFSIFTGYQSGIQDRKNAELTQTAGSLDEQFILAIQDLDAGRYEIARQRLNYVLSTNPNYPGVIDGLTRVELALNTTATPTVMPTPTLTPTPDTRGVDTLYEQAKQSLAASDWTATIDTVLALRKADPTFRSIELDGMLYLALRNRGVDKILQQGDLEGGTYDLALAERFGPLDTEARNYRIWVNLYVTGASFWEIDWAQAVYYFSQIAPMAPGLRDASGWTTSQRYAIALTKYAEAVAAEDDWCQAQELFESALAAGADPSIQELATEAAERCNAGGDDEPEDDGQDSSDTPIVEPTPTDSQQPTPLPSYP
jgi:tetratricopeptide (TPR) repeat protein